MEVIPVPSPRGLICGDLLVTVVSVKNLQTHKGIGDTVVSVKNLKTHKGIGDIYIEAKSYEHNTGENPRGSSFDNSPKRDFESSQRRHILLDKTSPKPYDRDVYFNEELNLKDFTKGVTHEISFVVKQYTNSEDVTVGEVTMKSDDYLDPFRPAREVYLLFDTPPQFESSLYLKVLFIPSKHTLEKMGIPKPVPADFDAAYHDWILSKNIYVDEYKFIVPIGKYHPRLVEVQELDFEED